jgi:hypothetical protein
METDMPTVTARPECMIQTPEMDRIAAAVNKARKNPYHAEIFRALLRRKRLDIDPRHIEGWMRCEHGTLDALTKAQFSREVTLAIQCIDAKELDAEGNDVNEVLARSYGL